MSDIDNDLRALAQQWRHGELSPPDLSDAVSRATRHEPTSSRWLLTAVSIVITLVLAGAVVAIAHRPGTSRTAGGAEDAEDAVIVGTLRLTGGAPSLKLTDDGAIPGTVLVYRSANYTGPPTTSIATDSHGRYRVHLLPGTYYLAATSPVYKINPPHQALCQTGPVHATAGTTIRDIGCGMK